MRRTWLAFATVLLGGMAALAQTAADFNKDGIAAYEAKQFEEAIRLFEKAYERVPENETVRNNLCNAHQASANDLAKAENYQGAVDHLERAAAIAPRNPAPLVQLGSYYLHMGHVADAIYRLEEAIEIEPGYLDAHEFLGRAYYADGDLPYALTQWEYVLEVAPDREELKKLYEKARRESEVEYDFERGESRHFRLKYDSDTLNRGASRGLLQLLERIYRDVCRQFNGVQPPVPIEVTCYSAEGFSKATNLKSHVGAVYDGKIRTPLTNEEGVPLEEDELRRRLTHEFVHVIVRHIARDRAPWWLNEGLAETLSKGVKGVDIAPLRAAIDEDALFGLAELESGQLDRLDAAALRVAYAEAHGAVAHLWGRFGNRAVCRFLTEIAAGGPPQEALRRQFRLGYADLEARIVDLTQ